MDHDGNIEPEDESRRYQGYVRALHLKSKRRRASSTVLTIVALFSVPAAMLLSYPRWYGLVTASILAVLGKGLARWASVLAGEADAIHRRIEYSRAFGWPIDKKMIVDIREKYRGLDTLAGRGQIKDYYSKKESDIFADKSGTVVASMFMESSWWTERLSRITAKIGGVSLVVVGTISLVIVVLSWIIGTSVEDGVSVLSVCVILASDLMIRQRQYAVLQRSSGAAYSRISGLVKECKDAVDEKIVLAAVHDYMIARSVGPPVSEWLYKRHQRRLTQLWNEELGDE